MATKVPRFTVAANGRGHPGQMQVWIYDDQFHWDASMRIKGDFTKLADKMRFAQSICDILNENVKRIPAE
jgi:hypothetical protein